MKNTFAYLFIVGAFLSSCDFTPQKQEKTKAEGFPEIKHSATAQPTKGATGEPTSPNYNASDTLVIPEMEDTVKR